MKKAIRAALIAAISVAMAMGASAQEKAANGSASKNGEKTVEEAYLQESAETVMIKELAKAEDLDSKQLAIDYARRAVEAGRKGDEVRNVLQTLALESNEVVIRSAGLGVATNDFPNVRRQACILLGEFPSIESKDTLIKVAENSKKEDPMVLAEAIRSLGKIGMNDNDEVVNAIAYSVDHFDKVGIAEDRLAIYTMFAFSDLLAKGQVKDITAITKTVMSFKKGSYVGSVKKLADETLNKLAGYQTKGNSGAAKK